MGTRILIVDDSLETRTGLEEIVRSAGLGEVVQADSAQHAFEQLGLDDTAGCPSDVDLILLEVELPGLDGIRACRRIHQHRELRHIPIVMVSAHFDAGLLDAALREGAIDFIIKPVRPGELIARVDAALRRKLDHDREEREKLLLQFRAGHDTLTGISRRGVFLQMLESEWRRARRQGRPLSFVMIDVDNFHAFNDTYGHLAGDECLRAVSEKLRAGLCRPADLLCRYGGEEFAVLLPETDLAGAINIAEQMRARVEGLAIPHATSSCAAVVTASFGAASMVPTAGSPLDSIIKAADTALYTAKAGGRNCVRAAIEEVDRTATPVAPSLHRRGGRNGHGRSM